MKDSEFIQIKNLKWLPWLGSNYFNNERRILIVGESHYAENTPERLAEFDRIEITRECIEDMGVDNNHYNVKFYQNLHYLLANNTNLNTELFWSRVCFYNFIQKTMTTSQTRPEYLDFDNSCSVFFSLLEKLEPNYCLMCGVSSIGAIRNNIEGFGFKEISFESFEKIGGSYPRILNLETPTKKRISLIFIKHPSQYFSYDAWKHFISDKAPELLAQFNDL